MPSINDRFHFLSNGSKRFAVAAVIVMFTALTACTSASHDSVLRDPPPSGMPSAEPLHPPTPVSDAYRSEATTTIAARLHTTPAAINQQLRAQPGSTLLNLAKPLGFAQDQLGVIVLAGLDNATNTALRDADLTSDQAARETQYWHAQSAPNLITETSYWYLHDGAGTGT